MQSRHHDKNAQRLANFKKFRNPHDIKLGKAPTVDLFATCGGKIHAREGAPHRFVISTAGADAYLLIFPTTSTVRMRLMSSPFHDLRSFKFVGTFLQNPGEGLVTFFLRHRLLMQFVSIIAL
jgi:hypothetical protein